ncbi:hypothetical protein ACQUSR_00375 [Streptomyces sp. P1-3]|uniref:hypothetical protein n=1 Tax=Streptomyces sp. P1-3 TaxID=3421658 RepID=UPI003D368C38
MATATTISELVAALTRSATGASARRWFIAPGRAASTTAEEMATTSWQSASQSMAGRSAAQPRRAATVSVRGSRAAIYHQDALAMSSKRVALVADLLRGRGGAPPDGLLQYIAREGAEASAEGTSK